MERIPDMREGAAIHDSGWRMLTGNWERRNIKKEKSISLFFQSDESIKSADGILR